MVLLFIGYWLLTIGLFGPTSQQYRRDGLDENHDIQP
jgi:hypothetical protein